MGSYSPRYVSASETHTDERSIAMVTPQTCSTKVASLGHSPISCARSDIDCKDTSPSTSHASQYSDDDADDTSFDDSDKEVTSSSRFDEYNKPLYEEAATTVLQSALSSMYTYFSGKLPKEAMDASLAYKSREELPQPNSSPASFYQLLRVFGINLNDLEKERCEYHCCPANCEMNFPPMPESRWRSHYLECKKLDCPECKCRCGASRFQRTSYSRIVPTLWGLYLGVRQALLSNWSIPAFRASHTAFKREGPTVSPYDVPDVLESGYAKDVDRYFKALPKDPFSIYDNSKSFVFGLGSDGESLFSREPWTSTVILLAPLDIHPSLRSQIAYTKLIQLVGGPKEPKGMAGHQLKLKEELVSLAIEGMLVGERRMHGVWMYADCDVPAREKFFNLRNHMSIPWCHRCDFMGISVAAPGSARRVVRYLGYHRPSPQVTEVMRIEQYRQMAKDKRKKRRPNGNFLLPTLLYC